MKQIFRALEYVQRLSASLLGKGYGTASIANEVAGALSFLHSAPLLAVDIGGNAGNYTAELRRRHPGLEIHIFEPSAVNQRKLAERFASDDNITIIGTALSDAEGRATLFSNAPGSGLGSLTKRKLDHFGIAFDVTEPVSTMRFERYWRDDLQSRPIDLCKMDIEGHELSALIGFGEALRAIKVLQFEFGGCNIDTRTYFQDFYYFFTENGFDLYRVTPLGLQPIEAYREADEFFSTTNYLAVNRAFTGRA